MTNTFTLIANQTVPVGGASSISFNSISSAYTDLKVVGSVRNNNTITFDDIFCSINGSGTTGSPFSRRILYGNGSGVATATDTYSSAGYASTAGDTSNTFGSFEAYFVNYASNLSKCYMVDSVVENAAVASLALLGANLWNSSTAISSLTFSTTSGNSFVQYSTFYLYGIKNS